MGIGAVCSALMHYLHTRKYVYENYPNAAQCDCLERLLVVYKGVIKVNNKYQVGIFFDMMNSLTNAFIVSNNMQRL